MAVTALRQFQSDLPRKTLENFLVKKLGTTDPYEINRIRLALPGRSILFSSELLWGQGSLRGSLGSRVGGSLGTF